MTFQWTAVATFLYGEVVVILVLCLPFISPLRWQKIFMIPLWSKIAVFWNKMFLTIIVLLIILFLDAFREVRKYSAIQVTEKVANVNTNAIDHIHMKLFRSQRNLYISGFSLFLWLVLRRTITLLTQLAKSMASHAALETQVNDTTEAAKKYLAENERLQEALNERGSSGNKESAKVINEKLKKEVEHLRGELQKTSNALVKANNEVTAIKKQSEGLKREYDRLMREYERLQESSSEAEDKKDLCDPKSLGALKRSCFLLRQQGNTLGTHLMLNAPVSSLLPPASSLRMARFVWSSYLRVESASKGSIMGFWGQEAQRRFPGRPSSERGGWTCLIPSGLP
uniref:Endoplasmic reticulum transmembrane protein n=1 Tax=Cairina moschata TaxID=8855 RepID=A0A8C3GEN5_CAIMO